MLWKGKVIIMDVKKEVEIAGNNLYECREIPCVNQEMADSIAIQVRTG